MHERRHSTGGAAAGGWGRIGPARVRVAASAPAAATAFTGPGWDRYLILVVLMVPLLNPAGPVQTAFVDFINLAALALFTFTLLVRGTSIPVPFLIPVLAMAAGSLIATTNARSVSMAAVTMVQDAYLYLWFVALVALMSRRGELLRVRVAWLLAADAVVLYSIAMMVAGNSAGIGTNTGWRDLLPSSDFRPAATFYNANQFGSYLMISMFVLLGLLGRIPGWLFAGSLGLLLLALVSTKSNGALIATSAGVIVWLSARAWAQRISLVRLFGRAMIALAAVFLFAWAQREWSIGSMLISDVQRESFVGRMSKSTESRSHIRHMLERAYQHSPLGIGPSNSKLQQGPIGERVRAGDGGHPSREAHSDYIGYAVERGPLALLGLLMLFLGLGMQFLRGRRHVAARAPGAAGATLWAASLGALAGIMVHALVIESLHFRHLWAFLAIACAVSLPVAAAWTPARRRAPALRAGGAR